MTLTLISENQEVINAKVASVRVAQRRFFNGLVLLGALLVLEAAPLQPVTIWAQKVLTSCSSDAKAKPAESQSMKTGDTRPRPVGCAVEEPIPATCGAMPTQPASPTNVD